MLCRKVPFQPLGPVLIPRSTLFEAPVRRIDHTRIGIVDGHIPGFEPVSAVIRFVQVISANPAKLMGMFPQKGTIAVGSDADISIFDPKAEKEVDYKELATNCDWNPFQGEKLGGFADTTLSRGRVIVENGQFCGEPGWGKFVKRSTGGKI